MPTAVAMATKHQLEDVTGGIRCKDLRPKVIMPGLSGSCRSISKGRDWEPRVIVKVTSWRKKGPRRPSGSDQP